MKIKINYIILVVITLLLSGCNGYVSQGYYESYANGELSKSLRDKYRKTYGKKWKEYEEHGIAITPKELFAREDYTSVQDYYKQQTSTWDLNNKDRKSKEYCAHFISFYIPVNFWNLRFNDKQYVKKTIKDLNKEGIKGTGIKYIHIEDHGLGTPIYSYFCIKITGEMAK